MQAGARVAAPDHIGAMHHDQLSGILEFLRSAERLKTVTRTSWTSEGKRESVAEHSWRLGLMAVVLAPAFADVDIGKLLKLCIIHDLGEAIHGDISATLQPPEGKAEQERADLVTLLAPLAPERQAELLALWDEYEAAGTPEAKLAKALDKLETILQHNQGRNPGDFDYAFNLGYGTKYTSGHPVIEELRTMLDQETASRSSRARREES